jgi:hypothetical protein
VIAALRPVACRWVGSGAVAAAVSEARKADQDSAIHKLLTVLTLCILPHRHGCKGSARSSEARSRSLPSICATRFCLTRSVTRLPAASISGPVSGADPGGRSWVTRERACPPPSGEVPTDAAATSSIFQAVKTPTDTAPTTGPARRARSGSRRSAVRSAVSRRTADLAGRFSLRSSVQVAGLRIA